MSRPRQLALRRAHPNTPSSTRSPPPPQPSPQHAHPPGVQKPGAGTEIPAAALLWRSLGLQVWDFTGLGTRARHNRKRCERDIQGDSDMGGGARSSVKGRMNFKEKKERQGKKGRWVVLKKGGKKGGDSESTTGVEVDRIEVTSQCHCNNSQVQLSPPGGHCRY